MKWVIENYNGSLMFEGNVKFSMADKSNANKAYFSDGKNKYGFYFSNGLFFVNNNLLNLKIDLNDYTLVPICTKTGLMLINQQNHENKLHSCNIGYKLVGQNNSYEYLMSIFYNGEVHLVAKRFDKDELVDQRTMRIQ